MIGLHAGQDALLKALSETDGQTMGDLAAALGVRPPTVTKMVNRLAAEGYVERHASDTDATPNNATASTVRVNAPAVLGA